MSKGHVNKEKKDHYKTLFESTSYEVCKKEELEIAIPSKLKKKKKGLQCPLYHP